MKKKYRWKMAPKQTGLSSIGAAPRAHYFQCEDGKRIASVCPNGGGWRSEQNGWFFAVNSDSGCPHYNSVSDNIYFNELADAKAAAVKYIKDNGGVL